MRKVFYLGIRRYTIIGTVQKYDNGGYSMHTMKKTYFGLHITSADVFERFSEEAEGTLILSSVKIIPF